MPVMLSELYDALRAADVPEDKARAAAEAVAEHREGIARLEARLDRIEVELRALRWLVGGNTALILVALGRLFTL